jgi:hypothetical protein
MRKEHTFWQTHKVETSLFPEIKGLRGTHGLQSEGGGGGRDQNTEKRESASGTHGLQSTSRGTSHDTETIRVSERHSHSGEHIGRDKSGHGKNSSD